MDLVANEFADVLAGFTVVKGSSLPAPSPDHQYVSEGGIDGDVDTLPLPGQPACSVTTAVIVLVEQVPGLNALICSVTQIIDVLVEHARCALEVALGQVKPGRD